MQLALFTGIVLPVFLLILIGYVAARTPALSPEGIRALSDAAFLVFMPALLFGAIARVDFDRLSPGAALAYYAVGIPLFAAVLATQRARGRDARASVMHALSAVFGNTVMLGVPVVRLAYGETGLALLLTVIAMHALIFLTLGTLALEIAAARQGDAGAGARPRPVLGRHVLQVARSSLIHPVVLPILAGLAWSAGGWSLPRPLDNVLTMLGAAATPLCLVLLGASLAQFDLRHGLTRAAALTAIKSGLFPLVVWLVGRFVLRLDPLPLAVATVAAALPVGANVYLFAQRYESQVAEVSAAVALSTLVAAVSLPWLLAAMPVRAPL